MSQSLEGWVWALFVDFGVSTRSNWGSCRVCHPTFRWATVDRKRTSKSCAICCRGMCLTRVLDDLINIRLLFFQIFLIHYKTFLQRLVEPSSNDVQIEVQTRTILGMSHFRSVVHVPTPAPFSICPYSRSHSVPFQVCPSYVCMSTLEDSIRSCSIRSNSALTDSKVGYPSSSSTNHCMLQF